MNKILSFVLVFVIALSFSACTPDKEVEYYEKQEVAAIYTIDEIAAGYQNMTLKQGSFIELTFVAEDLSYDVSTHFREFKTVFTYNRAINDDGETEQSNATIYITTTTPFYLDDTKQGDDITIKGFICNVNPPFYESSIIISPAFIIK